MRVIFGKSIFDGAAAKHEPDKTIWLLDRVKIPSMSTEHDIPGEPWPCIITNAASAKAVAAAGSFGGPLGAAAAGSLLGGGGTPTTATPSVGNLNLGTMTPSSYQLGF